MKDSNEVQDRKLTFISDSGEEIVAEIVFTYYSERFQKDYVVYSFGGGNETYASVYFKDDASGKLESIETEEEWQMLDELLQEYNSSGK